MSGDILKAAREDAKKILRSGGFQEDITITTPDKIATLQLKGLATKHHIGFDSDGNPINSKNVHINIDESYLTENGYPVRNSVNEVFLIDHLISLPDSTGIVRNYKVREQFPNETLGIIVCILEDYEN